MKSWLFLSALCVSFAVQAQTQASRAAGAKQARSATVVFMTGGPVDTFSHDVAGEILSSAQSQGRFLGMTVRTTQVWWDKWEKVCGDIAANPARGKVIIVGHSWGAAGALQTIDCLEHKRVAVDLLVTIDTIPKFSNSSIIADNVRHNYNFYETRDLLLRGVRKNVRRDGGTRGIWNIKIFATTLSPHTAIDNDVLPTIKVMVESVLKSEIHLPSALNEIRRTLGNLTPDQF